jgi:hypothetical protein
MFVYKMTVRPEGDLFPLHQFVRNDPVNTGRGGGSFYLVKAVGTWLCLILSIYFDAKFAWRIIFFHLCYLRARYRFWKLSASVCPTEVSEIFVLFHVGPKRRNCTFARSASAVDAISMGSGEFHGRSALIHHVLN